MPVTISTHNGTAVAREHNIRNEKVVSKENHINPDGIHEIWIDETIRQAYKRLFDESVQNYNNKQTRADRKIDSYYHNICKDKKKHPVYEMIIGIYGKSENGFPICSVEQGKAIMQKFVQDWSRRNPNLELIGAYHLKRATTLNKDQWLKERLEHKQKSSDSGITKSKNKIPLERFEQFAECIEKYGYSIKYNQITFIEFLKIR